MNTLFDSELGCTADAVLSECGTYRYRLTRIWNPEKPAACFIMLNPSTANATKDDPTIRRCVGFAKSWVCGGIVVVNLFAYRATDPEGLRNTFDPIGPDNERHIREAVAGASPVVAAWGAHELAKAAGRVLSGKLIPPGTKLLCLGLTKDGSPRHPLYVRADSPLVPWCVR